MEPDHHGAWAAQALRLGAVDVEEQAVLLQGAANPSWINGTSQTRWSSPVGNRASLC